MVANRISRKAQQVVDDLKKQIDAVINQDLSREPKLTESEALEVASLQARIQELEPAIPKFQKMFDEKLARLNQLKDNFGWEMAIAGENVDVLVDEMIHLEYAVKFLEDALIYATRMDGLARAGIDSIKKSARRKEQEAEGKVQS